MPPVKLITHWVQSQNNQLNHGLAKIAKIAKSFQLDTPTDTQPQIIPIHFDD